MSDRPIPAGSPTPATGPLPRTAPATPAATPQPAALAPAKAPAPAPAPARDASQANGMQQLDQHAGQRGKHAIPSPSGGTKAQGGMPSVPAAPGSAGEALARLGDAAGTSSSVTEVIDAGRVSGVSDGFRAPTGNPFAGTPEAPDPSAAAPGKLSKVVGAVGPMAAAAKTAAAMASLAKAIATVPADAEQARARDLAVLTSLMDISNGLMGMASFMKDLPPAAAKMLEKFGGITGAVSSVVKLTEMYKEMIDQPGKVSPLQWTKFGLETANFVGSVATAVGTLVPAVPAILGAGRALTLAAAGGNILVMGYENREIVGAAAQNAVTRDGWSDIFDYWTGRGLQARPGTNG